MNKPMLVGITGGIGAGKSTITKIFKILGAPVYDADSRAKWLQTNDEQLRNAIVAHFGEEAIVDGQLNRSYLAKQVFNDPEKLKLINSLVHPRVAADFEKWVEIHNNYPYLIKEAALMIESGSYQQMDVLINVSANKEERIRRVMLRDPQRSQEEIEAIIAKQASENQRKKLADMVIMNDNTELIIPKIVHLHQKWIKEREA